MQLRQISFLFIAIASVSCKNNTDQLNSINLHVSSSFFGWQLDVYNASINSSQPIRRIEVNKLCYEMYETKIQGNDSKPSNYSYLACNRTGEGLAMTVLNQRTGMVTYHKVLPMWEFWIHWDNLVRHLAYIPSGRIVIFSFSGQGSSGLRYAIPRLTELGSTLSPYLSPNSSWIWAFVKSGLTLHESAPVMGQPDLNASFPLTFSPPPPPPENMEEESRRKFCDENELIGSLCDDDESYNGSQMIKLPLDVKLEYLENVPIIVTAGSRLWYFSHTLRKVLSTPGVLKENIVVLIGGEKKPFVDLAKLLGVKHETIQMVGEENAKLFQYYREAYSFVNATYPDSPAVIFLDEDVEVSPDFFFYFNQTLPLLAQDSSLYCVNAFATARSSRLISDPTKVYRGTAQVAWGYSVTLGFVREALELWPTNSSYNYLFDQFLMEGVSEGRECIFPDQTRTLHFGSEGINTKATFDFELFGLKLPLVSTYGHRITNIKDMTYKAYGEFLERDILNATVLSGNPCVPNFIPVEFTGTAVIYYLYAGSKDKIHFNNFMISGLCLGFWAVSSQAFHNGVTTFGLKKDTVVHLVGVPKSPYSKLLSMDEEIWDAFLYTADERIAMLKFKDEWEVKERNRVMSKEQSIRRIQGMTTLFCANHSKSATDSNVEL